MNENTVKPAARAVEREARIDAGTATLEGELKAPQGSTGLAVFAHGSGSSRHSPRNQFVAATLRQHGVGTLLFDLLTREEEAEDALTGRLRFDIGFLADRLGQVRDWVSQQEDAGNLRVGFFGSSTGGGAALVAAAKIGGAIGAVVSRGGRPDLAAGYLDRVQSPTLLIVGGADTPVIRMNEEAFAQLSCEKEMKIIPGATHLFEEPGTLEEVARLAAEWFRDHLK